MNSTEHNPKMMAVFGPRAFHLERLVDATGISGTGQIAEGCVFADGTCVLRWLTKNRSTAVYASMRDLIAIHGHGGGTVVRWHGFRADSFDAKACLNCGHAMGDHWMDGAGICASGGCSCCIMEHPEFVPKEG